VLDKIDPRPELGGAADFVPKFASATVNENAARRLACVSAHLSHVGTELPKYLLA